MKSLLLYLDYSPATRKIKKRGCIICHPLVLKLFIGESNARKMISSVCSGLPVFG
jgi:hypothetical protein